MVCEIPPGRGRSLFMPSYRDSLQAEPPLTWLNVGVLTSFCRQRLRVSRFHATCLHVFLDDVDSKWNKRVWMKDPISMQMSACFYCAATRDDAHLSDLISLYVSGICWQSAVSQTLLSVLVASISVAAFQLMHSGKLSRFVLVVFLSSAAAVFLVCVCVWSELPAFCPPLSLAWIPLTFLLILSLSASSVGYRTLPDDLPSLTVGPRWLSVAWTDTISGCTKCCASHAGRNDWGLCRCWSEWKLQWLNLGA